MLTGLLIGAAVVAIIALGVFVALKAVAKSRRFDG